MTYELQTSPSTFIDTRVRRQVNVKGVEFPEEFLAALIAKHLGSIEVISKPANGLLRITLVITGAPPVPQP